MLQAQTAEHELIHVDGLASSDGRNHWPMTVFVFFAAAARARIVASWLAHAAISVAIFTVRACRSLAMRLKMSSHGWSQRRA